MLEESLAFMQIVQSPVVGCFMIPPNELLESFQLQKDWENLYKVQAMQMPFNSRGGRREFASKSSPKTDLLWF